MALIDKTEAFQEVDGRLVNTLCMTERDDKLLLGMKKRDFGKGRWNGFGGKVFVSETIEEGARRELFEECGIMAEEMEEVGLLDFDSPKFSLRVHIFRIKKYSGEPVEGEEMRPEWFTKDAIPYGSMWPDDQYWLPLFLSGVKFKGHFVFDTDGKIIEHTLTQIS